MPAIRTFAPIVAGMAEMNYSSFVIQHNWWNIVGSWHDLGRIFLGQLIPDVDKYLLPIIGQLWCSVLPALWHMRADSTKNHKGRGILDLV